MKRRSEQEQTNYGALMARHYRFMNDHGRTASLNEAKLMGREANSKVDTYIYMCRVIMGIEQNKELEECIKEWTGGIEVKGGGTLNEHVR